MKISGIRNYKFRISNLVFKVSVIFVTLSFISCSDRSQFANDKSNSSFILKDDSGIEVSFDSATVTKRIISLAPNITETIYALGADSLLVGVTDFCSYPPEAKNKPSTGSYLSPDYERIISLNPDIVLINVENPSNPTYQSLKNLGLKLFISNAKDLKGIEKMISDLGKITGKKKSADSLLKVIETKRNERDTGSTNKNDMNSLIIISISPLMTTNGKTFINEITHLAGFNNIYTDELIDYPAVNIEDVLNKNPDWIIYPADTTDNDNLQNLRTELKLKLGNTNAVKNDKIIFIDENIMFRPGPRVFEASRMLKDIIRGRLKD